MFGLLHSIGDSIGRSYEMLPLPQRLFAMVERFSARAQGKGWGSTTISNEVSACSRLLGSSATSFVDIGAHRGLYTDAVLSKYPNMYVHLFEPSAFLYDRLSLKYSGCSRVLINNSALSDENATLPFYSNQVGSTLGSLAPRSFETSNALFSKDESVLVRRFDDYWMKCSESVSQIIDYVKIDVEGFELNVLNGFGDLLSQVRLIQWEFGSANLDTRTYFIDFWRFFTEHGFEIYRITPSGPRLISRYRDLDESFVTTNYISVNRLIK
jgi:FkbM family methyltransferase